MVAAAHSPRQAVKPAPQRTPHAKPVQRSYEKPSLAKHSLGVAGPKHEAKQEP
jgi:hypothetical protein